MSGPRRAAGCDRMRAIVRDRYGPPDVLRFEELAKPAPQDGEVLVRIRSSSINTADLEHLRGKPLIARVGTGLYRPRATIPGFDLAGEVESVGRGSTRFAPGDRVWADMFSSGSGAFAEYVCAPEMAFEPLPPGISFEHAATVPHSALLALQALRSRGPIRPGDAVLVNGAGGCVGPFAIQIARSCGAEVTGVDHGGKLELMRSVGADHVIDYNREDFAENARRYDLILDIAANRSVFAIKRSLTPTGAYVQIARTLSGFFQAAVFGALFGGSRKMGVFMWVPNKAEDLAFLGRLIETGEIIPAIDRTYTLSQVPDAVRYLERGDALGKLVVTT